MRVAPFAILCLLSAPTAALAQLPATLPLSVHVAIEGGSPVVDDAFIDAHVERANAIFGPYGVRFVVRERRPLAAGHARIEDRSDRHALGAFNRDGAINCYFVDSLRDVDEPGRMRRGVHWHSESHAPAHFVIVSSIAFEDVLAHELGHFLGNPAHSPVAGNLMSYQRLGTLPTLDAAQVERIRRRVRRYLREGELVRAPLGAPDGAQSWQQRKPMLKKNTESLATVKSKPQLVP